MNSETITIYTDGSCNPGIKSGTWAAIILVKEHEIILTGEEENTTHNRMELLAVIKSVEYLSDEFGKNYKFRFYCDSQYVVSLNERKDKLVLQNFTTRKGKHIQNVDLVRRLLNLMEKLDIEILKIKAHQKKGPFINYNRKVDKLVRKNLRNKAAVIKTNG